MSVRALLAAVIACSLATDGSTAASKITTGNTSIYVGEQRWAWTVFIQAAPETIRSIRCVEYTLHPTFPNPVRQVCDAGTGPQFFALSTDGWGTFPIPVKIQFKNGTTEMLTHQLRFDPPKAGQVLSGVSIDNVATQNGPGRWDWTVFVKGPDAELNKIRCVEYTLHPTFPNPVREVCERGRGPQAFALSANGWGTFQMSVRVFLKDGQMQPFTYRLRL